ncbi:MAG: hypothetical protein K5694_02370 [Bacilli bacterium]|nr:hypothetical protein [Bacilli bacterium]
MNTELISLHEIELLNKKKRLLLVLMVVILVLVAGLLTMGLLLQNRSTQLFWIVGGASVSSILLIIDAYILTKMFLPLRAYGKFSYQALSHTREVKKVKIEAICTEIITFRGFKTYQIRGIEVDDERNVVCSYEQSSGLHLEEGETYIIETYDDVIVAVRSNNEN